MYKTRIAIFRHQGQEIIVAPLDCSFQDRPPSQQMEALKRLQKSAMKAGLKAPAAAVWKVGAKLHFVGPTEWHPFLRTLTWNVIIASLSSTLICHEDSYQIHVEERV
jgi:hypothetical protein